MRLVVALLPTLMLATGFTQSFHTGLADNGDFTRMMQWVVSRPEGSAVNWPDGDAAAYDLRFYQHWIARWHVDLRLDQLATAAALYWLPGILLSVLIHPGVVSLSLVGPCMEIMTCLLCFAFLTTACEGIALTLFFGVAFAAMLSTCDYAAYYSSFYAEAASGLSFLSFLLALGAVVRRPGPLTVTFYLVTATLLATCKLQNAYLWPLALASLFWLLHRAGRLSAPMVAFTAVAALSIGGPPICKLWLQSRELGLLHYNDYNRVYDGILVFADDPSTLLATVGGADESCIGTIAFTPTGSRCFRDYPQTYAPSSALRLLAAQPAAAWRMVRFAAASMQDISLEYLGKYEHGDPRAVTLPREGPSSWISSERRDFYTQFAGPRWNLWSAMKYYVFPRGGALLVYLVAAAMVFVLPRGGDPQRALRYAGLACLGTCATQLVVVVFGDGKEEVVKHLYLANIAFDVSLILLVATAATMAHELFEHRRAKRDPRPAKPCVTLLMKPSSARPL